MKHNGLYLRLTAMVLVLMLLVSCGSVLAEESVSSCPAAESETVAALLQVPDFKFFVREKGTKRTVPFVHKGRIILLPCRAFR